MSSADSLEFSLVNVWPTGYVHIVVSSGGGTVAGGNLWLEKPSSFTYKTRQIYRNWGIPNG